MGEETNKVARDDNRDDVDRLRSQIEQKRQLITDELEVLRQRRAEALQRAKQVGITVGATALGVLCLGSLVNAVADIFRSEDAPTPKSQTKLTDTLATLAVMTLRSVAMQYLKTQINKFQNDLRTRQPRTQFPF